MSRTSLVLLASGAGLLLALYVLLDAVRTGSPSDPGPPRSVATQHQTTGGPTQASPPPGQLALTRPGPHMPDPPAGPEGRPAPAIPTGGDDHPAPATRANTKNLQFGAPQLRAQVDAVQPLVARCIDDEVAAGRSPDGTALLTYIVAARGGKVAVEDTGVDADKTTLDGTQLIECLQKTSRAMKFEGLPREAEALVVSRRVAVDHGKLTENAYVTFSYLR